MSGLGGIEPEVNIEAGARLGDLVLVRELGRGNQGVVWEAQQASLGRRVAVKILPREITFVAEQVDRFHREAEAAARLAHPNIVAVFGFDDRHGHPVIVQEFVAGGSLEKVLVEREKEREKADVAATCRFAAETCRDLAEALDHAHKHNVVHRDIKPGNVLLTEAGVPKLADFGLAKVSDLMDLSHTGTIMGTPHYMSPEQVSPEAVTGRGPDARSDIYSLGAMLYRMLTHEVPFKADGLQRLFNDILTREPRRPRSLQPEVPPDLEAICLKALEKSPDRRYATARAFSEDLSRFLAGEPTRARPVGALGRFQRFVGRQSTVALAVCALLVATAWFAADVLLGRAAEANVRVHDVRLLTVALGALLCAWPLSLLGARLSRGRRWGAPAGTALALLAGAVLGFVVYQQMLTQRHLADRARLSDQLELESVGSRKDVRDIEAYVAAWLERFEPEDHMVVARAFLKRERPVRAAEWSERLQAQGGSGAVQEALQVAVAAALGDEEAAALAEARLAAAEEHEKDWTVWRRIGDILVDMHRFQDARQAYDRAARLKDADRDLLNLKLAAVSIEMCELQSAQDVLDDVLKWRPEDATARRLAATIAAKNDDFEVVEEYVEALEANPTIGPVKRLEARYALEESRGRHEEADRLVRESRPEPGTQPLVREWCARTAVDIARNVQRQATVKRNAGDEAEAERLSGEAQAWFDSAREDYELLAQADGDPLIGEVGLSGALMRLASLRPATEQAALYAQAVEHARRAIEIDPYFYEGHYNLGLALYNAATAGVGEAALTVDDWRAIGEPLQRSVQVNGLLSGALNNVAHVKVMLHKFTGEAGLLDEALGLARRAVALGQALVAGSCKADAAQRSTRCTAWDTLAEVLEASGDKPGALAAAQSSLAALQKGDVLWARREGNVARLQALVDAER